MKAAVFTLDARFLLCPLPVLRAQKILKNMKTGDILTITGQNTESFDEFHIFQAENGGFTIEEALKNPENWQITLKKC